MSVQQTDAVVAKFRDEITALDVRLLSTINERIKQVRSLREYKRAQGFDFVDPDREAALIAYLKRVNGGPISDDGLEELLTFVLDLVKRESAVGSTEAAKSEGAGFAGAGSEEQ